MVAPSYLRSLQAIELALRLGSLTKAADALSITPAAVGQRIKAIEDYLGLELVVRGRSGLQATPALSASLQHLHAAFKELERFSEVLDVQKGEEIHIAAPSDFVELWLAPRLPRFRQKHPRVLFCINGEGGVPYRVGRLDCSISFGPIRSGGGSEVLFRDFLLPIVRRRTRYASRAMRPSSGWRDFHCSISISIRGTPPRSAGLNGSLPLSYNARHRIEVSDFSACLTASTRSCRTPA
jgi:DNA-binding transcriptional LysR family regulator